MAKSYFKVFQLSGQVKIHPSNSIQAFIDPAYLKERPHNNSSALCIIIEILENTAPYFPIATEDHKANANKYFFSESNFQASQNQRAQQSSM